MGYPTMLALHGIDEDTLQEVLNEYGDANEKFKPFNSTHEGYAVLLEEFDELWEMVKTSPKKMPEQPTRMRKEAIQVAAMALRFLHDCC